MPPYAVVAVGLNLDRQFTYSVPEALCEWVRPGTRVLVPFGPRTITGYVTRTTDTVEYEGKLRPLTDVLDRTPTFTPELLGLLQWTAGYYQVPLGELMRKALPPSLHTAEKIRIRITSAGRNAAAMQRPPEEQNAAMQHPPEEQNAAMQHRPGEQDAVKQQSRSVLLERLARSHDLSLAHTLAVTGEAELNRLLSEGLVERFSKLETGGTQGEFETVVRIGELDDAATSGPRQREVVDILRTRGEMTFDALKELCPGAARAVPILRDKGVLQTEKIRVFRQLQCQPLASSAPERLTQQQDAAIDEVARAIGSGSFSSFLLHGVTGSGKTEVYMRLIDRVIRDGKTALVLVPEIALTPQLMSLFRCRFDQRIAVLHSALTPRDRLDQWGQVARGMLPIVLGARSAIFAPLSNLGLIVVDEEHEPSFKQDERPFYNARDIAVKRAQLIGCTVVLGSATPSLESYRNASLHKVSCLEMPARVTPRPLPDVAVVDLKSAGFVDANRVFSPQLADAVRGTLASRGQTILFLNRRGFAAFLLCETCGFVPTCPHCSISLTFYKRSRALRCHYCQHGIPLPESCPSCGKGMLKDVGVGTERVVEALREVAPTARVEQLDSTVSASGRLQAVLDRFRRAESDILVGTQIVAKGHDFPGVTLVGVLLADLGLSFPDFRAAERTFQLLTQVAGRAGRGVRPGNVIVQTYLPGHYALQFAQRHDFKGFAAEELAQRKMRKYPPFACLGLVRLRGQDHNKVSETARKLYEVFDAAASAPELCAAVLGPSTAPLAIVNNNHRMQILLRTPDRARMQTLLKKALPRAHRVVGSSTAVRWDVDVDPINMM